MGYLIIQYKSPCTDGEGMFGCTNERNYVWPNVVQLNLVTFSGKVTKFYICVLGECRMKCVIFIKRGKCYFTS